MCKIGCQFEEGGAPEEDEEGAEVGEDEEEELAEVPLEEEDTEEDVVFCTEGSLLLLPLCCLWRGRARRSPRAVCRRVRAATGGD